MSLISALKTAWTDTKAALAKAEAFLVKETPAVQAVVTQGSAMLEAAVPSLTPVVTAFDNIEESLVAEVSAAISDGSALTTSTGATTVTLSSELSGVLKSIVTTLSGHPAVVAVAAAAAPAPAATV